jgi:hypothetical protein
VAVTRWFAQCLPCPNWVLKLPAAPLLVVMKMRQRRERQLGPCSPEASPAIIPQEAEKKNLKIYKTKPLSPIESIKRPEKQVKTKPNEAKVARHKPFRISRPCWQWLCFADSKPTRRLIGARTGPPTLRVRLNPNSPCAAKRIMSAEDESGRLKRRTASA